MVQVGFDLRAKQTTTLTPRLQQSVKLLQMSAIEFNQELQHAIANNPFLEEDEEAVEGFEEGVAGDPQALMEGLDQIATTSTDSTSTLESGPEQVDTATDTPVAEDNYDNYDDWQESRGDSNDYRASSSDGERSELDEWIRDTPALRDHLRQQLASCRLDARQRGLAELVVEALEEDGYLREDLGELVDSFSIEPEVTRDEMEQAIRLVQQIDEPGIAARSLDECLLLQLEAMDEDTEGREVAMHLVDGLMERLARREYAELATTDRL